MARDTGIPTPSPNLDSIVRCLVSIKEAIETGQRLRGEPLDSFVRLRELDGVNVIGGSVFPLPPGPGTLSYDDLTSKPPYYIPQLISDDTYALADLRYGHSIIGVRYPGAAIVRIPNDLPPTSIVSIKDEAGLGMVTVLPY